jgi:CheY-like chemotaxis protein
MAGIGRGDFAVVSRMREPGSANTPSRDRISEALPYLRRYARAVTGSQESGDAFVRATLEAALSSPELHARISRGRVELYEAFSEIWNSANLESNYDDVEPGLGPCSLNGGGTNLLAGVSPIQRQALVLTQLEEFTLAEAGQVLGLSTAETAFLVGQAMVEIGQDAPVDILIIEDEPLISSHIEAIVEDMGHRVVAVAATAAQAGSAYAAHQPGLVLADIQLADGSSGLTAVDEILAMGPIPIIFITAFPEKLLTGERSEPSFLVAKPFREETLRATIGQALFFRSNLAA